MTRGRRRRDPGPGFAPFPRYGVLRVNDLVAPGVDLATVRAVLAAHGVREGVRDDPVGRDVLAVVAVTAAGTVITLQRRGGPFRPRIVVLWRLRSLWDTIANDLEIDPSDSRKPG